MIFDFINLGQEYPVRTFLAVVCLSFLCCRQIWYGLTWKLLSAFYLKPLSSDSRNPKKEAIRILEQKRSQLQRELRKPRYRPAVSLHVRRASIFQDSFDYIMPWFGKTSLKHAEIRVKFLGEDGIDVGGLTREWFIEISKQVYSNDSLQLFSVSDTDNGVLLINPFHQLETPAKSVMDFMNRALSTDFFSPRVLKQYRFFGIVIGKAIYESQLMNCHFTRSMYKTILNMGT
jgi:E3 ubiquitin-protein ligase HUWE1